MAEENLLVRPIGSSVDVGWEDGAPRALSKDAKSVLEGSILRVTESRLSGRQPRPRSKNAPKPNLIINYQDVPRNQMDNIDLDPVNLEELVLQNAEAMKQFEYLEKSLISFKSHSHDQASDLRHTGRVMVRRMEM